jgi:hypothetical protein
MLRWFLLSSRCTAYVQLHTMIAGGSYVDCRYIQNAQCKYDDLYATVKTVDIEIITPSLLGGMEY